MASEERPAAIVRLSAPWPVLKIAVGMIHMGAANDTFYLAVPKR